MPKRRANGEGNIRKRKDGRWEGRYTAGYDANGKVITKNVLGKTQVEVKDKLHTAIEDSKKLDPVKAGSYTLEQWLKLWYSIYVEPQVRYSTKEFYHNAIDHHIIPKLGNVKLEKLTMLQIQQFYNELLKSGRVQKKNQPELKEHGLSPRMVQCVHVVLNKALEHAVEEKLILANPAKKCKIPKNTRKEMDILPEALIGPYLSAAKEHGILAPMYLELTMGLRRGKLLALRWEDFRCAEPYTLDQQKCCAAEWKVGHQYTKNAEFHPHGPIAGRYGNVSCVSCWMNSMTNGVYAIMCSWRCRGALRRRPGSYSRRAGLRQ